MNGIHRRPRRHLVLGAALIAALVVQSFALISEQGQIDDLQAHQIDVGPSGPPGPAGPAGPQGIQGKDGKDGKDGRDGHEGQNGQDGQDGREGRDGTDGREGRDGKDGTDGKDGQNGQNGQNANGSPRPSASHRHHRYSYDRALPNDVPSPLPSPYLGSDSLTPAATPSDSLPPQVPGTPPPDGTLWGDFGAPGA
ncbi:hypothetical protein [Streptomyces gibsoniae]|uniref:Collagen-like protein n=1 Tax=Streptomyces gibsoniae TaxID=3075529 RepID=A0ABU2TNU0_9ACTN|nr:hypothetical protein [Streptomyces sp. DSM 41699]MDT0462609.1 hypothetical protein [Streptomyces sp. DSM 41699]